jgi:hypothetical protein
VRYTAGVPNPGFLLARTGPQIEPKFWAMFNDAFTEQIDPPSGAPRPDPDPAVRTKNQSLPPTLQSGDADAYTLPSRFSGQMRKVVQCEHSRGIETRFSHTWSRTHGLLEFPQPHRSGSDKAAETALRSQRKYFVIEISSAGVYAAPVEFGIDCLRCAPINEYMLEGESTLNLAQFYIENPAGRVQRVMSDTQIAPAFAFGSPWYAGLGWAYAYSGIKAANVVVRSGSDGYSFYETRIVRLAFSVTMANQSAATIVRSGSDAIVLSAAHGFIDDEVVSISGADQEEYNGAHIVRNATDDAFRFTVAGTPSSPATGTIVIADINDAPSVSATLTIDAPGRVIFKQQGGSTLWYPESNGVWRGVLPLNADQTVDGPVHVFFDGEDEIVTRWSNDVANHVFVETSTSGTWQGNATGTHAHGGERLTWFGCQYGDECESSADRAVLSGSGERISAHVAQTFGFYGAFDARAISLTRDVKTGSTAPVGGIREVTTEYSNFYALCPSCYFIGPTGNTVQACGSTIRITQRLQVVRNTLREYNEVRAGASALILFSEEREAIAAIRAQTDSETGREILQQNEYGASTKEEKIDTGDCPFTDYDEEIFGSSLDLTVDPPVDFDTTSRTGAFYVRGVSGFGLIVPLSFSADGQVLNEGFAGFLSYTLTKQTAESTLFFMRGGLFYDEPSLTPQNQKGNRVFVLDTAVQTQGGFEQLNNRTPISFVGEV